MGRLASAAVGTFRATGSLALRGLTRLDRLVRAFEPWGILLTVVSVSIAMAAFILDLEQRQVERTFRAWQVVDLYEERTAATTSGFESRSTLRTAVEFLNWRSPGFICSPAVERISVILGGSLGRTCIFPRKARESLGGLKAGFADLSGANLSGAYLVGAHFSRADISRSNLSHVNLSASDLSDANLFAADLSDARLAHAQLSGAILLDADLSRAVLSDANLTGANLRMADFSDANLSRSDLSNAILDEANLLGANLSNANLKGALLDSVRQLTQIQLDSACGSSSPLALPPGLRWNSGECVDLLSPGDRSEIR